MQRKIKPNPYLIWHGITYRSRLTNKNGYQSEVIDIKTAYLIANDQIAFLDIKSINFDILRIFTQH